MVCDKALGSGKEVKIGEFLIEFLIFIDISSPPCRFNELPCTIQFYDIPSMIYFLIIRNDISRIVTISFGISAYLLAGNIK